MQFNVYDGELTKLYTVLNFVSLVWTEEARGPGEFQAVVNLTDSVMGIQPGMFVGIRASDSLMYIESIEDKNGQRWLYGHDAKYLLDSRVYDGQTSTGNIETILRAAFEAKRPFPFMALGELNSLEAVTNTPYAYETLFALSVIWCEAAGYGFRLRHDRENKKLLYEIYSGVTRENVKYSQRYGNCWNLTRAKSEADFKNVAYVAGSGEGMDRTFVVCGDLEAEGLDRREIFIEAGDLSIEENQTQSEYEAALAARGLEELAQHVKADEVSFNIPTGEFGEKFFLNDNVTCAISEYGVVMTVPVIRVTYTYEGNQEKIKLGFGVPVVRKAGR